MKLGDPIKTISHLGVVSIAVLMSLFAMVVYVTDFSHPRSSTHIYKGIFHSGYESLSFKQCNTNEVWWVEEYPNELAIWHQQLTEESESVTDKPKRIYIEFTGRLSERGTHGHLGTYSRGVWINDLVAADRVDKNGNQCEQPVELPIGSATSHS